MERVTAANPFQRTPETARHAVQQDRIYRILGTRRGEPAGIRRQQGRNNQLVGAERRDHSLSHLRSLPAAIHILRHIELISPLTLSKTSRAWFISLPPSYTNNRLSAPPVFSATPARPSRSRSKAARMSLLALFLFTALYFLAEMEKPARTGVPAPLSHRKKHRNTSPSIFLPDLYSNWKDPRPRSVSSFLTYRSSLTVSFFLPRARLRASTLRPVFVAMRARNPCVFFRFRLCG